ncbi:MAG: protein kinase, partial [Planctomycetes bacterium]|nr:protein kinase [Planctomycetota bacterium]
SLQERISQEGPLDVKDILRISIQTAKGLAAAHAQGIVHRDVKPANILLESGLERVMLSDFGLARAVDDATITRSGMLAGTPEYMSPEQAKGEMLDQRSDLFGFGCVMYAMCTGHSPFRADSTVAVLKRICELEPRKIAEVNSDIPTWLTAIIGKLLEKNSADRYVSAGVVAELLEQCLAHVQQPATVRLPAEIVRLAETVQVNSDDGDPQSAKPTATETVSSRRLISKPVLLTFGIAAVLLISALFLPQMLSDDESPRGSNKNAATDQSGQQSDTPADTASNNKGAPGPVAQAVDPPSLADLIEGLQKTEAAIKNLSVTTEYVKLQKFSLPVEEPVRMELVTKAIVTSDGRAWNDCVGQQVNIEPNGKDVRIYRGRWRSAFDGKVAHSMSAYEDGDFSFGSIDGYMGWHGINPQEFTTHYFGKPISTYLLRPGSSVVRQVMWDDRKVTIVETAPRGTRDKRKYRFWIDPERRVVVRRTIMAQFKPGQEFREYSRIESRAHQEIRGGIWLPERMKYESVEVIDYTKPEELSWSYTGTNKDWKVNQDLPDETFRFDFPKNVRVTDNRMPPQAEPVKPVEPKNDRDKGVIQIPRDDDKLFPAKVKRIDFSHDASGKAIGPGEDISADFIALGCTLETSFKTSFVTATPYNIGGRSRGFSAANHNPMYQGTMTIRFCKPGDAKAPAAVTIVGFWIGHVSPQGAEIEFYDHMNKKISSLLTTKNGREFIAVRSKTPIAYLRIVPDMDIDPDFAIDDLVFDTPKPVAKANGDAREDADKVKPKPAKESAQKNTDNTAIAGHCRDVGDKPIQGATITLYRREPAWTLTKLQRVRTDDIGAFRFEPVSLSTQRQDTRQYLVVSQAMNRGSNATWINGGKKKPELLKIELRKAATVTGTVRDSNGKPVKDAFVSSMYIPRPLDHALTGRTDANGRYVINDLPKFDGPEVYVFANGGGATISSRLLSVRHPDFAIGQALYKVAAPGKVDITLQPAAIIEGRVLDGDGRPAVDVVVTTMGVGNSGYGTVLTDKDGRYRFSTLPAGAFNIWALKEGWTVVAHDSLIVTAGETLSAPDLR